MHLLQIIDPRGVSLDSPDGKFHVPCGTIIASPIDAIHRDADIYPHPNRFNPFRFVQPDAASSRLDPFSTATGTDGGSEDGKTLGNLREKSSATLDEGFLGFGFGKHACPGRFFALNEMKIFVAHMVMTYDVEYLGKRPGLTNMVWLKVPFKHGIMRVRKRQVEGSNEEAGKGQYLIHHHGQALPAIHHLPANVLRYPSA